MFPYALRLRNHGLIQHSIFTRLHCPPVALQSSAKNAMERFTATPRVWWSRSHHPHDRRSMTINRKCCHSDSLPPILDSSHPHRHNGLLHDIRLMEWQPVRLQRVTGRKIQLQWFFHLTLSSQSKIPLTSLQDAQSQATWYSFSMIYPTILVQCIFMSLVFDKIDLSSCFQNEPYTVPGHTNR